MIVILTFSPNSINRAGYLLNIGPPIFMDELKEIILIPNNSKSDYELPMIKDPDDDAYELSIDLQNALSFTKITNNNHLSFDHAKVTQGICII
jgi:hypothetical protein